MLALVLAATGQIDLAPLIDGVVAPILSAVLMALASWALVKIAGLLHIQISDSQRNVVLNAIPHALTFAEQKLLAKGATFTASEQVAEALNYLAPKVSGALAWLGITPEHLAEMVTARLPK